MTLAEALQVLCARSEVERGGDGGRSHREQCSDAFAVVATAARRGLRADWAAFRRLPAQQQEELVVEVIHRMVRSRRAFHAPGAYLRRVVTTVRASWWDQVGSRQEMTVMLDHTVAAPPPSEPPDDARPDESEFERRAGWLAAVRRVPALARAMEGRLDAAVLEAAGPTEDSVNATREALEQAAAIVEGETLQLTDAQRRSMRRRRRSVERALEDGLVAELHRAHAAALLVTPQGLPQDLHPLLLALVEVAPAQLQSSALRGVLVGMLALMDFRQRFRVRAAPQPAAVPVAAAWGDGALSERHPCVSS